jgi:dTDP-4-dehydrorhamnose reductase
MVILVIGSNGQLGWELVRKAGAKGFDAVGLDLPAFDVTDASEVRKIVRQKSGSLIINAAAYTAVDRAESEQELVFAVNRDGPAYLASACAESGVPIIHISTDYVFDGSKREPYLETDPIAPLGVYGKSKAEGEAEVKGHSPQHIIVRTAWLYGCHGHNFVKTMLRLGRQRETISVVADQYGCPTYAADLADAILMIARRLAEGSDMAWGTYHYCGKGATTWHGFAEKIFDLARDYDSLLVHKVVPITTAEYPTPAKRPVNSVLDCSLINEVFGISPQPWERSLDTMLHRYYHHED